MLTEVSIGEKVFRLPLEVCNSLQAQGKTDEEIYVMTPRERFIAYCEYEGLVNWGDTLWLIVRESLEGLAQSHALETQRERVHVQGKGSRSG